MDYYIIGLLIYGVIKGLLNSSNTVYVGNMDSTNFVRDTTYEDYLDHRSSGGVNPATGLPMHGAVDIGGNPFGCGVHTDTSMCSDTFSSSLWSN